VAGEQLPPPPARWWEATLRRTLEPSSAPGAFRIVRSDGYRAIVAVDQSRVRAAREAWTTVLDDPRTGVRIRTRRTWGTLRGAKAWLREAR
jgi:RNase P/RNase MRP subunit POP5